MTALRRRMLEDMQVRHLSAGTQQVYLQHIARFARYCGRSPAVLGPEEIRAYQLHLTNEKQLTPATLVIVVSALRFLYRVTLHKTWSIEAVIPAPKKPQTLPVVLSPAEVVRLLDSVKNLKHRTILTTCYAAGLRISEAVRLTVSAIDSQLVRTTRNPSVCRRLPTSVFVQPTGHLRIGSRRKRRHRPHCTNPPQALTDNEPLTRCSGLRPGTVNTPTVSTKHALRSLASAPCFGFGSNGGSALPSSPVR